MTVCSADRFLDNPARDYERSPQADLDRELLKSYLDGCEGFVSLADLKDDLSDFIDNRHISWVVTGALGRGILEIQGLTPQVVLRPPLGQR